MDEEDPRVIKEWVISSLFSRRNEAGTVEESYVSHVQIWEEPSANEGGGLKSRYIILGGRTSALYRLNERSGCEHYSSTICTAQRNGNASIYKAKKNQNQTFSIGKTWKLVDLRGVEVNDVSVLAVS